LLQRSIVLFGRLGRERRSSRPGKTPHLVPVPASAPAARKPLGALHERLKDITATRTPEDAMALVLQEVVDAVRAAAAAYCLYDPREQTLCLAAEVGISDEGCQHLRRAREGVPIGWDMPLHSLLNRRTYLIESAPRNRYVPPLVEQPGSIGTVACLPVHAGELSFGSLIVVTRAPRCLDEKDLATLEPALRALGGLTQELRRRAGDAWWPTRTRA
jgi:GAF domain-containing protein